MNADLIRPARDGPHFNHAKIPFYLKNLILRDGRRRSDTFFPVKITDWPPEFPSCPLEFPVHKSDIRFGDGPSPKQVHHHLLGLFALGINDCARGLPVDAVAGM